jgi:transporter family-2 protein
MTPAYLAAALAVGTLLAVQAAANLRLTTALRSPYGAACLQLALAAAILGGVAAAGGALPALAELPAVPWWHLLGGLASPLYVVAGILLFPRLGAVVAVGLFVTGQVLASLALDVGGFLDVARRPVSAAIFLGPLAVLAGITAVVRGHRAAPGSTSGSTLRKGWLVLGVLAGAGLPVQGALNALLRAHLGEPLAVGLVSFGVATVVIVVIFAALRAYGRVPAPHAAGLRGLPWWGWLGAVCAAAYVVATFLLIPLIGAAATVAFTVTGQQAAAAAIDHFGLLRLPRRPVAVIRGAGLALLAGGSLLIQFG